VKLRGPVDDQGDPLAPFERTLAVWRELRAPIDLYDVEAAAAAELAAHGAILRPPEAGFPGPAAFYARRWWRLRRPAFLGAANQLTEAEARILAHPGHGWTR
jgi:hypothetical protein